MRVVEHFSVILANNFLCVKQMNLYEIEFPNSVCDNSSKQRKIHKSWIDFNRPIPMISMKTVYSISTHVMLYTDIYKAMF